MINDLIYDIGMHNGDDTAYYLSRGYRVLAIDASPLLVEKARERYADFIAKGRLEVLNIGIGSKEEVLDFYLNKTNSVWNSFDKKIGARANSDYEVIQVQVKPILKVLEEKGIPKYMKIDIEGNDILCLDSLAGSPEKPAYISAESASVKEIEKMRELGYTKFKIINQASFLPLEMPMNAEYASFVHYKDFNESRQITKRIMRKLFRQRINRYYEKKYKRVFAYDHPFGSSGPFGEALPGRWLDFNEAVKTYEHYRQLHERLGSSCGYDFWNDVHATCG